jgi:EAL domain-containing protein (putative c-di-GMP-specific phosphodiesterase class I)
MGLEIVIDDFGTGYSSLSYLKRMPVVALKIDRSFIFNMMTDEQDEIIVTSTINLAHNLGLNVVAEGVENIETMNRLKDLGCDLVQGYYVSRPMSAENVWKWLDQAAYTTKGSAMQRPLSTLRQSLMHAPSMYGKTQ